MNQSLEQVIYTNMMETVKQLREQRRQVAGIVFRVSAIANSMQVPEDVVRGALERLRNANRIHMVSKDNYSLGIDPMGGKSRKKTFKCEHCGHSNMVEILAGE